MKTRKYQKDKPEFVFQNIYELRAERRARYMSIAELSERSGICYQSLKSYEARVFVPDKINYNRLASVWGWQEWKD